MRVKNHNERKIYAAKFAHHRMVGACKEALDCIRTGVDILGPHLMNLTTSLQPHELVLALRGKPVGIEELKQSTRYGNGITPRSLSVQWFWKWMEQDSTNKVQWFLMFVMAVSVPPAGGMMFCAGYDGRTQPPTIYKAPSRVGSLPLPSAATCMNRLLLPVYATEDTARQAFDFVYNHPCEEFDERAIDTAIMIPP